MHVADQFVAEQAVELRRPRLDALQVGTTSIEFLRKIYFYRWRLCGRNKMRGLSAYSITCS